MIGRVVRSLLILAIGYGVGGRVGLIAAAAAVAVREVVRMPVRVLWVGAVLAMAAAPLATLAQGLPSTPVTGTRLIATHLAANALVIVALILAVHAGIAELTDPASADTAPLIRPLAERRPARPAPSVDAEQGRTEAPAAGPPTRAPQPSPSSAGTAPWWSTPPDPPESSPPGG